MAIGFIKFTQEEGAAVEHEQHAPEETRFSDEVLERLREELFNQVRWYAAQLERVDPASYNAVQEVSKVMSALSRAVTPQEHLQALTGEAKRLMLEVAEAKLDRRIKWALRVGFAVTAILIAIDFSPAVLP
jgi:hypothetical protein